MVIFDLGPRGLGTFVHSVDPPTQTSRKRLELQGHQGSDNLGGRHDGDQGMGCPSHRSVADSIRSISPVGLRAAYVIWAAAMTPPSSPRIAETDSG